MTIQEAIQFCRANSARRNNVLYFAQQQAPNAYKEWFKSNRYNGFAYHFAKFGIKLKEPLAMFMEREAQLVEKIRTKSIKCANCDRIIKSYKDYCANCCIAYALLD